MEGKTRFSRSKVPLYALEIWFLCIPFCHAQVYEAARASWLASGCLHVPVCGGTPQRDGAQRNRAAWQNGNCTERYGGTPQRDGAQRNRAAWQNGNRAERYGGTPQRDVAQRNRAA